MTARQIIQEIETLPREEQREVFSTLRERFEDTDPVAPQIRYADHDAVIAAADRIFTERAELFQKLAQ